MTERYKIVKAMLADPLNRICVERALFHAEPSSFYPPPIYDNGDAAFIVDIDLYAEYESNPYALAIALKSVGSNRPVARIYRSDPSFFQAVLMDADSIMEIGPFTTRDEAVSECSRILQDDYGISVLTEAPWAITKTE